MVTWFIADLHLSPHEPNTLTHLNHFIQHLVPAQTDALYIVGDLFEYWVGDDWLDHPSAAVFLPTLKALRQLSQHGVRIYLQHGNRDFLIGERLADYAGLRLLPEQITLELYGTPTLVLHGDSLCTDDVDYQRLKLHLRHPQWQQHFLALPLEERLNQARALRAQSLQATQSKAETILDVNLSTVAQVMQAAQVRQLIHGHTHRPAIHEFTLFDQPAKRIVLGDWYANKTSFLQVTPHTINLM